MYKEISGVSKTFGRCRRVAVALVALLVAACSGGGGGAEPPAPPVATPPPVAPAPTRAELNAASRFAATASFGLDYAGIQEIATLGTDAWLDRQFALPVTRHMPLIRELLARRDAGEFADFEEDIEFLILSRRLAWWHHTVTAEDVLRQRVAFALSEILVVSDNVDELLVYPDALGTYYDLLLSDAFGNFRTLLRDVSLHPAMGFYLSHINNSKSNPANNTFPDENYAREVMQLFSIGLFELNGDGSLRLDNGEPVPTYSNDEIREFAKVFTGLSWGGPGAFFGRREPNFSVPMQMFDEQHETGPKTLLRGTIVPAGQSGLEDIEAAIENLFNHPNVGPFIGKQLIQRLVTSNPSPAYVSRVTNAFNDNGSGVRGDMRAVIRAILTDPEAAAAPDPRSTFGKLREPAVRYASMLRQLGATSDDGYIFNSGYFLQELTKQHPLSSPSVFNFYLPSHSPAGEIADQGLVAPEFQIVTSNSIVGTTNLVDFAVSADFVTDAPPPLAPVSLTFHDYVDIADDVDALVDRLELVMTAGTLDPDVRRAIRSVVADVDDLDLRMRVAIYLVLISADYAVRL
jgi:uncharacterized protein (DUF1800 family)